MKIMIMKKIAVTFATALSLVLIATAAYAANSVIGEIKPVPVVVADKAAGGIQDANQESQAADQENQGRIECNLKCPCCRGHAVDRSALAL